MVSPSIMSMEDETNILKDDSDNLTSRSSCSSCIGPLCICLLCPKCDESHDEQSQCGVSTEEEVGLLPAPLVVRAWAIVKCVLCVCLLWPGEGRDKRKWDIEQGYQNERGEQQSRHTNDEYNELHIKCEGLKKEVDQKEKRIFSLEQEKNKLQTKLNNATAQVSSVTHQLSKVMQQKLSEDETSFENINTKNRPSKTVDACEDFFSNEWLDAKEDLDAAMKDADDQEQTELLCSLLMECYTLVCEVLAHCRWNIQDRLVHPLQALPSQVLPSDNEADNLPGPGSPTAENFDEAVLGKDLVVALNGLWKDRSDEIDINELTKWTLALASSRPESVLTTVPHSSNIDNYIKQSCRLSWRMLLQRPPMKFLTPGIDQAPTTQELYYSNKQHPNNVIISYVVPIIAQKDKQLTTGKVYVKPAEDKTK